MPANAAILSMLLLVLAASPGAAETVPVRVDFAPGTPAGVSVPVRGGIPFPRGVLADAAHVQLLAGREEVPCQVLRTAVWPDGSVKWALVDAVLSPKTARSLRLRFGEGVLRSAIRDPLEAKLRGGGVIVRGPDLIAGVDATGRMTDLSVGSRKVLTRRDPGVLVFGARCSGALVAGKVVVESRAVESPGPIRARIVLRGHLAVEGWGDGYPARVLAEQPAEQVPFTLRYDFVRGLPVVLASHQIVYTGEPDEDFVVDWRFDHPAIPAGSGSTRVTADDGNAAPLTWAPLTRGGFALLPGGYQNRPFGANPDIAFWPSGVGPWDLRRYAREWAVGESGRRDRPEDMERYARVAAYGMARSHDLVLEFGGADEEECAGRARAYAAPAILVAPPSWYARTGALGSWAPESPKGPSTELDRGIRRYLDWFRFNQDLYRWYGPLAYGFWQTRNGNIHRHDRWDRDYGRWGWSLNDGAGRIGHVLMLTYLRTLERRYLDAGAAFNRAAYDTAMVHTERHLENATASWWRVKGCSHRHGVQPFSDPYIGMRGSYPEGARIQWLLTGDGVLRDGLDLAIAAARDYATTRPGAFGASGGSDGQGAGALALLHAYETTGDRADLDACRRILDKSKLIPPAPGTRLGYGPSFGLFLAASEYLDLTGDEAFRVRFLALADRAVAEKDTAPYLTVLAHAFRLTGRKTYREAIERTLAALDFTGSLAELPTDRWPGHGGPRQPPSRANVGRDLPYALGALEGLPERDAWPKPVADHATLPARVPDDWWRPGGHPTRKDRPSKLERVLAKGRPGHDGEIAVGDMKLVVLRRKLSVRGGPKGENLAEVGLRWGQDLDLEARPQFRVARGEIRAVVPHVGSIRAHAVEVQGRPAVRFELGVDGPMAGAPSEVVLALALSDHPAALQLNAAGAFRVERWRVDMNDEAIPEWLNSDGRTRWPIWRGGGIVLGDAGSYRIFRLNRPDTAPVFVDEGFDAPGWLDLIDRGGTAPWGVTVRLLPEAGEDDSTRSILFDHEAKAIRIRFEPQETRPHVEAFDVVFHEGWRPPLLPPDLTREQYMRFLDDLDRGENIGLFALRHLLSTTHKIPPGDWKRRLADRGVEPREILLGMAWRDGLRKHCERIGVRHDPAHPDATVQRVIEHYRRRR